MPATRSVSPEERCPGTCAAGTDARASRGSRRSSGDSTAGRSPPSTYGLPLEGSLASAADSRRTTGSSEPAAVAVVAAAALDTLASRGSRRSSGDSTAGRSPPSTYGLSLEGSLASAADSRRTTRSSAPAAVAVVAAAARAVPSCSGVAGAAERLAVAAASRLTVEVCWDVPEVPGTSRTADAPGRDATGRCVLENARGSVTRRSTVSGGESTRASDGVSAPRRWRVGEYSVGIGRASITSTVDIVGTASATRSTPARCPASSPRANAAPGPVSLTRPDRSRRWARTW